ncbi:MAG: hypothetical protein KGI69_02500 [Patescibacteria group bacterium]|nr:hypothetical protein [Patescibacteria group bacterium]
MAINIYCATYNRPRVLRAAASKDRRRQAPQFLGYPLLHLHQCRRGRRATYSATQMEHACVATESKLHQAHLSGIMENVNKVTFQASLPVTFLREGDQFVAYTPALDLSTSGDSFEQAKKRFGEVVQIFFEECVRMGTLSKVLIDLGWVKQNSEWNPPTVVAQDTQMVNVPMPA